MLLYYMCYINLFSPLFFKSHKITGPLYDRVIGFYTFRWMRTKGFDQDKLSEYLPSSLVSDISTVLYSDFIAKVNIFLAITNVTMTEE